MRFKKRGEKPRAQRGTLRQSLNGFEGFWNPRKFNGGAIACSLLRRGRWQWFTTVLIAFLWDLDAGVAQSAPFSRDIVTMDHEGPHFRATCCSSRVGSLACRLELLAGVRIVGTLSKSKSKGTTNLVSFASRKFVRSFVWRNMLRTVACSIVHVMHRVGELGRKKFPNFEISRSLLRTIEKSKKVWSTGSGLGLS